MIKAYLLEGWFRTPVSFLFFFFFKCGFVPITMTIFGIWYILNRFNASNLDVSRSQNYHRLLSSFLFSFSIPITKRIVSSNIYINTNKLFESVCDKLFVCLSVKSTAQFSRAPHYCREHDDTVWGGMRTKEKEWKKKICGFSVYLLQ